MAYILDTNILSELRRGRKCDPRVRRWVESVDALDMFISVVTLGEIRAGVESLRCRDPKQAAVIESWLLTLPRKYAGRTLTVTAKEADQWGRLSPNQRPSVGDGLIAATALQHGLTVATRNTSDFERCGVPLVNPFLHEHTHG